jgi:hypothetical protein
MPYRQHLEDGRGGTLQSHDNDSCLRNLSQWKFSNW